MAILQSCALTAVGYEIPSCPFSAEIDQVLLHANHASEIIRNLYRLFKDKQRKVSFGYICRKSGIPSKGYLGLVMNGQRRLHEKYWDAVFQTFKLNEQQRSIFRAFLELDQADCEYTRTLRSRRVMTLREALRSQF